MRSGEAFALLAFLFLALAPAISAAYPFGLVSYWPFDSNAIDAQGMNNGTIYGAALNTTGGKVGGAYSFSRGSAINMSNSSTILQFTLESWIKPSSPQWSNSPSAIISKLSHSSATSFGNSSNWDVYDATNASGANDMKGFEGAVFDGRYVYFAPNFNGASYGKVLRYDTTLAYNASASWDSYDASAKGSDVKGFLGAVFDGRYVYFVPRAYSKVLRYDTTLAYNASASWDVYETTNKGSDVSGFYGAVFDGRFLYFVPYSGSGGGYSGKVLRYDTNLSYSSNASWDVYNAANTSGANDTKGFNGAVFDGRYVYFVPYYGITYSGKVLRYDTTQAYNSTASWDVYNAENATGANDMQGFNGAVFDGRYVYFVPCMRGPYVGKVLRYDTTLAYNSSASWDAYNAESMGGYTMKGFNGAVFDGKYVYFVPLHNGLGYFGKVLRYDTTLAYNNSTSWSVYNAEGEDGYAMRGFVGAVFDGRYAYFVPYYSGAPFGRVLRYDTAPNSTNSGFSLDYSANSNSFGPSVISSLCRVGTSSGIRQVSLRGVNPASSGWLSLSGSWHHVACAYNGTALSLYIDGSLAAQSNYSSSANAALSPSSLFIGSTDGGQANYKGMIDEVAIFNYSLDAQAIQQHYNNSKDGAGNYFTGSISATGGAVKTILVNGTNYTVHTFTGNGTFNVTGSGNIEALVVAGGGGGGGGVWVGRGGGGGAGGLVYNASFAVTSQAYSIVIGGGGPGGNDANGRAGINGLNSSFSTLIAIGGGGGGAGNGAGAFSTNNNGRTGGSGGGSSTYFGAGIAGNGTFGQGYAGGNGLEASPNYGSGGGGGAGSVAANGTAVSGGNGGIGLQYSISGTSVYYAGGGGSVHLNASAGLGGLGGGGNGTNATGGTAGVANTGSGGGGGRDETNGSAGGSGIVIIRYLTSYPLSQAAPNATTFGGAATTNFSAVPDLTNVTNLTLEVAGKGKIQFPANYPVNAVGQDYDANVKIGNGYVSVNSSALHGTFNSSAQLTINASGVYSKSAVPGIKYYTVFTTNLSSMQQNGITCTAPQCVIISWDSSSMLLVLNVTGFSGYGVYDNSSGGSIGTCGNVAQSGNYNLLGNINYSGTCLNISVADVSIDCLGYSISGDNSTASYGVYTNQFNTSVKNCIISNFTDAVHMSGATGGAYSNNTFMASSNAHVSMDAVSYGNVLWANNFTGDPAYYSYDLNGGNSLNGTINSKPYGNIYQNVINGSVNIVSYNRTAAIVPGIFIGDMGFAYPYNSSNSLDKIFGLSADYAPLTIINSYNQITIYASDYSSTIIFATPNFINRNYVELRSDFASDTINGVTGFYVKNIGNTNVSVSVLSTQTASQFIGGTNPLFEYVGAETAAGACTQDFTTSYVEFNSSYQPVCGKLNYAPTPNEIATYFKVGVPSDATEHTGYVTITFSSTPA